MDYMSQMRDAALRALAFKASGRQAEWEEYLAGQEREFNVKRQEFITKLRRSIQDEKAKPEPNEQVLAFEEALLAKYERMADQHAENVPPEDT